jgi:hypothetical protein
MKFTKILILILGFLLFSTFAVAKEDALPWLRKEIKVHAHEKLMFSVSAYDDCPLTENEISQIVQGVLIRSRLKSEKVEGKGAQLYLSVSLRCTKPQNSLYVFSSDIYFAKWKSAPILIQPNFGRVGDAKKQTIRNSLKESIEGAVTVYIATNFM